MKTNASVERHARNCSKNAFFNSLNLDEDQNSLKLDRDSKFKPCHRRHPFMKIVQFQALDKRLF